MNQTRWAAMSSVTKMTSNHNSMLQITAPYTYKFDMKCFIVESSMIDKSSVICSEFLAIIWWISSYILGQFFHFGYCKAPHVKVCFYKLISLQIWSFQATWNYSKAKQYQLKSMLVTSWPELSGRRHRPVYDLTIFGWT